MEIVRTSHSRLSEVDLVRIGFGEVCADHMAVIEYRSGAWQEGSIIPYGPLSLAPSTAALHYGQCIFEGMKAFRGVSGDIRVFRPDRHLARLNTSARRLCIPEIAFAKFKEALRALLSLDREWAPGTRGYALYIRPFIFASDAYLGVRVSRAYTFVIITSPVGAYYDPLKPVSLITSGEYARAVRGGVGTAKAAGNYAAALLPTEQAHAKGFTQVLWLDAIEKQYIEEVGTMNIFFVIKGTLVTPSLEGTILPGVTRDSVIQIAKRNGIAVEERRVTIKEIEDAVRGGTLEEAFGTGTAAVITPIGEIMHEDHRMRIGNGEPGRYTKQFYDEITAIQYGEKEDTFRWCEIIE